MKKIIACIVLALLVIGGIAAMAVFKTKNKGNNTAVKEYGDVSEAVEAADFDLDYTDRLSGVPATGYKSSPSTIEVTYGDAGFIRKTYESGGNADNRSDLTEELTKSINGYDVTLKGNDGVYYLATWSYNGYYYTVSINDTQSGADLNEMIDYIETIR